MKKGKKLLLLLLLAMTALLLGGCGIITGSSTLRVGVKDDVANFGLYDPESGRYSGMEIDLAQMISDDLGYGNLELVSVTAANREEMLDAGKVDLIIATYSITDERQAAYSLSSPYYRDYVAIMVEKSSMITGPINLKGCTLGVMKSSNSALAVANYMHKGGIIPAFDEDAFDPATFDGGVKFLEFDTYAELSDALEWGTVDAFVSDRSILGGYMKDDRVLLPSALSGQQYAVCAKKGSALGIRVNDIIDQRLADGSIEALKHKWGN